MTPVESALRRVLADLAASGLRCALVGGLAVSARTEPRFTRDADLAVAVRQDREVESLLRDLQSRGYGLTALIEQDATHRIAAARLLPPQEGEHAPVDLLFASSGIEPEIVAEASGLELLPGLTLAVSQVGHLMALKLLSRSDAERPQDAADLRALRSAADAGEIARAREAVALISARGFARGRDLAKALDALLA